MVIAMLMIAELIAAHPHVVRTSVLVAPVVTATSHAPTTRSTFATIVGRHLVLERMATVTAVTEQTKIATSTGAQARIVAMSLVAVPGQSWCWPLMRPSEAAVTLTAGCRHIGFPS